MDLYLELTESIYHVLDQKKALYIEVLSLKGISSIADYFVIATATSTTHMQALVDYVEEHLERQQVYVRHKEGKPLGGWMLLDYGDIVVHVFNQEMRDYYALERIWNDAKKIKFNIEST